MRYSIQRRLVGRSNTAARWITMTYVDAKHRLAAMGAAINMAKISVVAMELRVCEECPSGAHRELALWSKDTGWVDSPKGKK